MIIGERVSERLSVVGLSQAALGRRVRLDQSTINGLIKGEQRSSTKLHNIARELRTTPAYLTGETDDPDQDAPDEPLLDADARALIDCYDQLAKQDREALLRIAHTMAGKTSTGTVHAPKPRFQAQPGS